MSILVQKFGGTSVATPDRIRAVARRVIATKSAGHQVVVVVSAMAGETDRLLQLASSVALDRIPSEVDVVASTGEMVTAALVSLALQAAGAKAQSLLGFQLPILTNDTHNGARILSVNSAPILACLESGVIPVIAGFQGVDEQGRITTLGRGGSDTTAVAIAASLGGTACEIYTDVDGVFSADPRICSEAKLLPEISYRFMCEAANLGAKVMHDRSVALGMRYRVPIVVKNSFHESLGTEISNTETPVNCVTIDKSVARVSILSPKSIADLGKSLSELAIPYSMLSQTTPFETVALVPRTSVPVLVGALGVGFVDEDVAKVSLVGALAGNPGQQIPNVLSLMDRRELRCHGLSAGNLSVSFLVPTHHALDSVQLLHSLCTQSATGVH